MKKTRYALTTVWALTTLVSAAASADGLADLKAALNKLKSDAPLTAVYSRSFTEISDADDEDDRKETTGEVAVLVSDDDTGLQVTYSEEVLERIEIESEQKAQDEEINTPTLNALGGISATQLSRLLSASSSLSRMIARASYIGEESHMHNDKPVRLLSFNLPLEVVVNDKKARDYVKKFEGVYRILIDENGIPLETRTEFKGKGRAFVVLSVTVENNEFSQYQVFDGRLVRTRNEYSNSFSSTFGDNQSSGVNTVTIRDDLGSTEVAATQYQF